MKDMQRMLDKEFDQRFRQEFEQFEAIPPEGMWSKIAAGLNQTPGKRKNNDFLWIAAASVSIVLCVGLLFVPAPKEKIWLHKEDVKVAVMPDKPAVNPVNHSAPVSKKETPAFVEENKNEIQAEVRNPKINLEPTTTRSAPVFDDLVVAKTSEIDKIKAVASQDQEVKGMTLDENNSVMLASISKTEEISIETTDKASHGIQSIGGLVNFVVGKVDKRQDKIVEFKDTDEGSLVSGINLGFVKIKSRNQ